MQEENRQTVMEEQAAQEKEELVAVGADGVAQPEEEYTAVGADGVAQMPEQADAPQPAQEKKPPAGSGRRDILHLVCGAYLLYLAYKLASGFIAEYPQSGWTTNLVVAIVGAVVFTVVGAILLIGCIRRFLRRMKDSGER